DPQKRWSNQDSRYSELFSLCLLDFNHHSLVEVCLIVFKADDNGEGGTFALYSLLCRRANVGLLPSDISATELMHQEEGTPSKMKVESGRARRSSEDIKHNYLLLYFFGLLGSCPTICDESLPLLFLSHDFSGSEAMFADLGHFSKTIKCQALACVPRVKVIHTSDKVHGQVYNLMQIDAQVLLSLSILIGFRDGQLLQCYRIGHKEYKIYRCIVRYGYRDHVRMLMDFEDQIISLDSVLVPAVGGEQSERGQQVTDIENPGARRYRFMLPAISPKMNPSVRKELQELVDARKRALPIFGAFTLESTQRV
ncbi:hypothetical protein HAX54_018929, partial [Datura stramonium]|nr:hypothetical protein [Datura stramonium]